jgi:hypothetical protein
MAFQKVDFNKEFFNEFSKDPKNTFKNYGIEFLPADDAFFKQDFKKMSFDDFKSRIEKSRFFNFFDFSA